MRSVSKRGCCSGALMGRSYWGCLIRTGLYTKEEADQPDSKEHRRKLRAKVLRERQ